MKVNSEHAFSAGFQRFWPTARPRREKSIISERVELSRVPRSLWAVGRLPRRQKPVENLAPSPAGGLPGLGHFGLIGRDDERLVSFLRMREQYGDMVRLRLGALTAHLVSGPELIKEVLQTRNREFDKCTRGTFALRLLLGRGLLTSEGSFWLRQRRIAQPAFHRDKIQGFADSMVNATENMSRTWSEGQVIDAHEEMMRLTMQIVGETLLGSNVSGDFGSVSDALETTMRFMIQRVNSPINLTPLIPTARNRRFLKASRTLDEVVLKIIRERRQSKGPREDLLQLLMDARDADTGEGMNDTQLRDEVMTIFLAGHETTANALSWTLYLLSKNPQAMRLLADEVDSVLSGRSATARDLAALSYTRQVVEEAMRLFPPAWMLTRSALQDTELGGYFVPKRSLLFLSPFVVHRHPDHWANPEGFDPSRFDPAGQEERHKFAYFPFGAGPRRCIGSGFALMEAQLILATMVQRWRLELVPGASVRPVPSVTLRPFPLRMVIRSRCPTSSPTS